ncbi:hypothetical protein [Halorientalis persicus]|uniref:hypothetical protein n=1 Tax=Halorientalis persicus TaxID=1367881 RepID=UPI0011139DA9|nr:hypothetical protein [Halorientalis persicus]
MSNSDKPSPQERKTAFIKNLKYRTEIQDVVKVRGSEWKVNTNVGECTIYLHYYKWFREPEGPPGYFQGSWEKTKSANQPLYHVFLGPSDQSVRVVPNNVLMSPKFDLILDHAGGDKWRLNVNSSSNNTRLEDYTDLSLITRIEKPEVDYQNERGEELQNLAKDILDSETDDGT